MKLVFIYSLDDGRDNELHRIIQIAGATVFSESPVSGVYTNAGDDYRWFGQVGMQTESKMYMLAVTEEQASDLVTLIDDYNEAHEKHPFHAYSISVDQMTQVQ
ncbi:hypothetical protein [Algivirga pacifica]|uniref:Transcriptional regulator n=1 Tax=Algivirga pacifica TaxID=1162670 RepID=A0ABP9DCH8_9BACT